MNISTINNINIDDYTIYIMVKYLVGILCSSNVRLLKESFLSVLNQTGFDDYEIMIIVNTLNEEFYQDVMYEFGKNNYTKLRKIIRTESNGSPGKGHNSVLKTFYRDYRYDNLIMLDGDDFLFPNAIHRINNVCHPSCHPSSSSCRLCLLPPEQQPLRLLLLLLPARPSTG